MAELSPPPADDGALTLLCTEQFASLHGTTLLAAHPDLRLVRAAPGWTMADGMLDEVDVAFASPDLHPDGVDGFVRLAASAPRLRWLQMFAAGLDYPALQLLRDNDVRITSASGATASAIARTVVFYLLTLSRGARRLFAEQAAHRWSPQLYDDIAGKTIGVVGMGPIGLEIIRMAAALGMRPIGMRRTVAGDEPCETWTLERMGELAATVDVLALALPLTAQTKEICSADVIAALKPGALIVNVGRGGLVDEPALERALASGALGGAGLDVFVTEPLPGDSPLWDLPNVIVTPHTSAATPAVVDAIMQIFFDNLAAFRRGTPLVNEERA